MKDELFIGSDNAMVVVEGCCVIGEGAMAQGEEVEVLLSPCSQEVCTDVVLFWDGEIDTLFASGVLVAKYMVVCDLGWDLSAQLHGVDDCIQV